MKRIISSNILGWARGIMCLLPVTLLSLSASAQKQWTLEDCINYAIENNITLRQAKLKQHGATENRKQSAAALFPTLSASTNQSVGYRPWQNAGTATVNNGYFFQMLHIDAMMFNSFFPLFIKMQMYE